MNGNIIFEKFLNGIEDINDKLSKLHTNSLEKNSEEDIKFFLLNKKRELLQFWLDFLSKLKKEVSFIKKNFEEYYNQQQRILREIMAYLINEKETIKHFLEFFFDNMRSQTAVLLLEAKDHIARIQALTFKDPKLREKMLDIAGSHLKAVKRQMECTDQVQSFLTTHMVDPLKQAQLLSELNGTLMQMQLISQKQADLIQVVEKNKGVSHEQEYEIVNTIMMDQNALSSQFGVLESQIKSPQQLSLVSFNHSKKTKPPLSELSSQPKASDGTHTSDELGSEVSDDKPPDPKPT